MIDIWSMALALTCWALLVQALRFRRRLWLRQSTGFELAYCLAFVEFPAMWEAATSFGFLLTFAVPSVSVILRKTRGFADSGQRRYDDTALLMHAIAEHGPHHPSGIAAMARLNQIHRPHPIRNADMLFTLWVFCFEPLRWVAALGYRAVTPREADAVFAFWRDIGVGLQIQDIPPTRREFECWGHEFMGKSFRYFAANRELTDDVLAVVGAWGPSWAASKELKVKATLCAIFALLPAVYTCEGEFRAESEREIGLLVAALGLTKERDEFEASWSSWLFGWTLAAALRLWAGLTALLLPPRPRAWASVLLAPAAGGIDGCPVFRIRRPAEFAASHADGVFDLDDLGLFAETDKAK